ncbi:hypothetical protein V8B55DRAFT_1534011 [Mucor lusitanicus]
MICNRNKFFLFMFLVYSLISTSNAAGRACIVGLDDCPDGETCIVQEGDYGHCG